MRIKYTGQTAIQMRGQVFVPGETAEVSDVLGEKLITLETFEKARGRKPNDENKK